MSAEVVDRGCRDCELGEIIRGGVINLPLNTRIPLDIVVTPKIKRKCLYRWEIVKDLLLSKVEETIGYEIPIKRDEHTVAISAKCVKPDSYIPRR